MPRFVALLRGINVGGNTMVKMEELRAVFEALRFENVTSYINSGNVAFDARGNLAETALTSWIESTIEKTFKKSIPVMVRKQAQIRDVIDSNPFAGEFASHKEMHVLFMKDNMLADKERELLQHQTADERFAVVGREIYCHLRLGVADSLLGKGFIDRKLKVPVTARNWRTVEKLAVM
jgi:uncharacterized protein (DUF1697 family)